MTTLELYTKGARVWVPHPEIIWEGAELLEDYSPNKSKLQVITESGEVKTLIIKLEKDLPFLRNPPILIGENDLTSLSYLHEPAVLYNLQVRFCQQKDIYTYCGIVLVAVNPYDELPIYDIDTIQTYRGQAMGDLNPHIFAVAEEAYTKLEREQSDQSIIVSGESGAGKTVSAKYAMRYFATIGGSTAETQIEKKVLASSPIMEAIGNAKTTRNDNSSRFGKFIELQFNKQFNISGASMRTYLLEKSRVVFQAPDERNYHIFYQLCAARDSLQYLYLDDHSKFHYLNQGGSAPINGVSDLELFKETTNALSLLGFTKENQHEMFKIFAAILHLGNIEFVETIVEQENEQDQEGCTIRDTDRNLELLGHLLQVNIDDLKLWLCTKKIVSMREVFMIPMTVEQAVIARDALSKHIYAQLFDWIVLIINKSLESNIPKHKFIGVLDIYGFETFEVNSFEQFCINYANEKLQQQFNLHVFKLEQEEYIKEGIEWKMIDFYDNQPCIDLIEAKLGVLDLLDEECRMPKGSDHSWTEKLYSKCMRYSHFGKARFGVSAFTINHFADKVQYESNGFLEKNRDTVVEEQIGVIKNSNSKLVRKLFNEDHSKLSVGTGTKLKVVSAKQTISAHKAHKKTVGSQFRDSLNMLMTILNATTPHYVRCIKPNDTKSQFEFDPGRAVQQLRACGVIETIRISAAGFPSRWTYLDFFYRYRVLCKFKDINWDNMKETCKKILAKQIRDSDVYQFGKTKIFFRAGQVAYLEKLRSDRLRVCCIIMQSTVRAFICRKKYLRMINAVYGIQRYGRGYLARRLAQTIRRTRAAVTMQRYVRGWIQRKQYTSLKFTIEGIQKYSRGYLARKRYILLKDNAMATIIQRFARGYLARKKYRQKIRKIIVCQSAVRRYLARKLYKKLKIEARSIEHVKSLNKGLENKIISLQQKIDDLNKQNTELKKRESEVGDLRNKLSSYKNLDVEIKNLNNLIQDKNKRIEHLEERLKTDNDEKMDILQDFEKYKADIEEQRMLWKEETYKLQTELDNINEIVKVNEKGTEERIEREKLLIINEQDSDRHAYQKLLQEYYSLEQRYENSEKQLRANTKMGFHTRNASDVSNVSTFDDNSFYNNEIGEEGYSSIHSTPSTQSHSKLENIDYKSDSAMVIENQSSPVHERQDPKINATLNADTALILKLQHKLSNLEREKSRLQKRLDDFDTSPRTEKSENAIRDSIMISELEVTNSLLKTQLCELQASIKQGDGHSKLFDHLKQLQEELDRKAEEIVQLRSVLAEQTNSIKSMVNSKSTHYINEDGELALAYETQKVINKQLELELQDEKVKYKAHEQGYIFEIDKLREDNERQQRLLSLHLEDSPQTKSETYLQHEITRLTNENLNLQENNDKLSENVRKLKKHVKLLTKKLKEVGFNLEDEVVEDGESTKVNTNNEQLLSHERVLPNIIKKERDYLGMFAFKCDEEPVIMKQLVLNLQPRTAVTLLPGLPAYIIFMCIRHTDYINDEDKVKALLSNFVVNVKKTVRFKNDNFESMTLWFSNTVRLLHNMKQYSGDTAFQRKNTQRQNEQCLRNFDLSEYRLLLSDTAIWIHEVMIKNIQEKIQQLIVPAILEHEEIRGISGNKLTGFRKQSSVNKKDLDSPVPTQKPTTALLQELTNHHKILTFYGVDTEVISQIFRQIFYFICASSLNNLLLRKELCHWSKGFQIRHNLSHFEMWTREKQMDEQSIQSTLQPIVQASHLLQARKTDEDVESVCEMCNKLTPLQICKILNLYTPVDEFEQRVPASFIQKIQIKLKERPAGQENQTLLMDIKYRFPVRFPFNPSSICLEDIEIPEVLQLPMLEKI